MEVLDLRSTEVKVDYSRSDINWIASGILAVVMLAGAIGFNLWLNQGCTLSGYLTWHGKVCLDQ